jgi:hypothetical protein
MPFNVIICSKYKKPWLASLKRRKRWTKE